MTNLRAKAQIDWSFDEFAERYARLCDVAERMWQHWPLNDGTETPLHTSIDARAAARQILEILGIELQRGGK